MINYIKNTKTKLSNNKNQYKVFNKRLFNRINYWKLKMKKLIGGKIYIYRAKILKLINNKVISKILVQMSLLIIALIITIKVHIKKLINKKL